MPTLTLELTHVRETAFSSHIYIYIYTLPNHPGQAAISCLKQFPAPTLPHAKPPTAGGCPLPRLVPAVREKIEVDAMGVITISRGCFERCGRNKKTPP